MNVVDWPVLRGLSEEDRRRVLSRARRRRFARNQVIFYEGDPGDTLHLIDKGHVAVQITAPLGEVATLAVLGPGEVFGELAVTSDNTTSRTATITSLEPTETLTIRGDDFEELRRRHPSINELLLQLLTARIPRTSSQLLEALYVRAEKRVLRRVIAMAELYGDGRCGTVIPLTQDDLAEMAGATRPTVNRVLKDAEAAGIFRLHRRRIELLEPETLARRAR